MKTFKQLSVGQKFLLIKELSYPDMIQKLLIKISNDPWLVKLPYSGGYSAETKFNSLVEHYPSLGLNIGPDEQVVLVE